MLVCDSTCVCCVVIVYDCALCLVFVLCDLLLVCVLNSYFV